MPTKQSILIVDNEFGLAEMLREMLRESGDEVTLAINGKLAHEILREGRVDLVLTDMMMPVMDGAADTPAGWAGLVYYRLHGAPRKYWSKYGASYLRGLKNSLHTALACGRRLGRVRHHSERRSLRERFRAQPGARDRRVLAA